MEDGIFKRINKELDSIDAEEQARILFACESGSRAWGFESEDSDYDVRFIYIRRTEWYLTIHKNRDVIEKPVDDSLDISGWDLPKALQLFMKSNPPLLEWLQSPIVYREEFSVASRLRELMPSYYSPISCMYHYLHMAKGNYRDYLQGEEVWVKKYLYVLRPILACIWIERGFGVVPTEFTVLIDSVVSDGSLKKAIFDLLGAKKRGMELDRGPRISVISDFIDGEISRLSVENRKSAQVRNPNALDQIFVEALIEVNGPCIEPTGGLDRG